MSARELLRSWVLDMPADNYLWLSFLVTFGITSIYWLYATHPVGATETSLRANGLTNTNGKQFFDWGNRDISTWSMIDRPFEGSVLQILLLKNQDYVAAFALPGPNTRDRVIQILCDKQIPKSPDLMPPWESQR